MSAQEHLVQQGQTVQQGQPVQQGHEAQQTREEGHEHPATADVGIATFSDAVKATFRHEEWKYTNLASLITTFGDAERATKSAELATSDHRILIVNGIAEQIIPEATVLTSAPAIESVPGTAAASPFTTYVAAEAQCIVEVRIPKNTQREQPIVIDVVTNGSARTMIGATRIRIIAEEGSSVVVHEKHHGSGSHECMDLTLTEIVVHANSTVQYAKHTQLPEMLRHIGSTIAHVHAHGTLHTHAMCLGGPYVRNDLYIRLEESGAEAYLNGLSVLRGHEVADNHTTVDHLVPRCHSDELYKGIYYDASMGIFNGKVLVRPDAQKTTAYQSSRSLLLGDRAQINAKPQLEIWADDVKCSHGATTGQLDNEAIFYLRSRGLTLEQARALLVDAFAQEMYDRLP